MGDAVLVSFCNVPAPYLPLLGLFHPESATLQPLKLPAATQAFKGITGIAESDRYLYAVAQLRPREGERFTTKSALLVFSRKTLDLASVYEFQGVLDGHSLALSGERMYVASSGTDQIVELEVRGAEVLSERPYLQAAQGHLADMNHINGLCDSPDGLIMSAFGLRTDPSWSSATNGFILDVKRRERIRSGLQHPHSPFALGRSIIFCESRKTSVQTVAGDRRQILPGYTRGICKWGNELCVATSVGRKTSRSTGKEIENPGAAGVVAGGCTISRIRADDFGMISTFEAPLAIGEIYDLMTVCDVGSWPIDPRPLRETSIVYYAVYLQGSASPFVVQDPTVGSAPLLLSDEAAAKRVAGAIGAGEIRQLSGTDTLLEALGKVPETSHYVALDARLDENGRLYPNRLVPMDQFKRSLGMA